MNSCRFLCIGLDFIGCFVFYSLVKINMSLPGFLRFGLDIYGLEWVSICCGNNEKDLFKIFFLIMPYASHFVSQAGNSHRASKFKTEIASLNC